MGSPGTEKNEEEKEIKHRLHDISVYEHVANIGVNVSRAWPARLVELEASIPHEVWAVTFDTYGRHNPISDRESSDNEVSNPRGCYVS